MRHVHLIGFVWWAMSCLGCVAAHPEQAVQARPVVAEPAAPAAPVTPAIEPRHPLLLVRAGERQGLATRLALKPWSSVVAVAKAQAVRVDATQDIGAYARNLRDDLNASGLAWLAYPADQELRSRVEQALRNLDRLAVLAAPDRSWIGEVHVGNTMFTAMLVLDLHHDRLDEAVRRGAERTIDGMLGKIAGHSWSESAYGLRGTWALYRGDHQALDENKAKYRARWEEMVSPDGVFVEGPGYALARMARNDREQKHLFMDVLAINGEDDWYGDARMQRAYRWLWAHAMTANGTAVTFGDSTPGRADLGLLHLSAALLRTARFDPVAAAYGARFLAINTAAMQPQLSSFLLGGEPVPPAQEPLGGWYPDGGAWLRGADAQGLESSLWNPLRARWHNHRDVNAVQVSAAGVPLLRNVGYAGANRGVQGRPWSWVNDQAESSNTLLHDGANHDDKVGAGVRDGWIGSAVQYATGSSGPSLARIRQERTLVQIGAAGAGDTGYWMILDRVRGPPGSRIQTPWHAASDQVPATSPDDPWCWTWPMTEVSPQRRPSLAMRLLTHPASVEVREGAMANWNGGYRNHYLLPTYRIPERGWLAVAALALPLGPGGVQACAVSQDAEGSAILRHRTATDRLSVGTVGCAASWSREGAGEASFAVWEATAWTSAGVALAASQPLDLVFERGRLRIMASAEAEVSITGMPGRWRDGLGAARDLQRMTVRTGETILTADAPTGVGQP